MVGACSGDRISELTPSKSISLPRHVLLVIKDSFFHVVHTCNQMCGPACFSSGTTIAIAVIEFLQVVSMVFEDRLGIGKSWASGHTSWLSTMSRATNLSGLWLWNSDYPASKLCVCFFLIALTLWFVFAAVMIRKQRKLRLSSMKLMWYATRLTITIGFMPVQYFLISSTSSCRGSSCDAESVGVLAVVICFAIVTFALRTCSQTYIGLPSNHTHVDAIVIGRIEGTDVIAKTILCFCFAMANNRLVVAIVFMICSIPRVLCTTILNPYLNSTISSLKTVFSWMISWVGVLVVINVLIDGEDIGPSLGLWFGGFFIVMCSMSTAKAVSRTIRHMSMDHPFAVLAWDVKARRMLDEQDVIHAASGIEYTAMQKTTLDKISAMYSDAILSMGQSSSMLYLLAATFRFQYLDQSRISLNYLNRADALSPWLDVSFAVFSLRKQIEKLYSSDSSLILLSMAQRDQFLQTRVDIIMAMQAKFRFFTSLLERLPNVESLNETGSVIFKHMCSALSLSTQLTATMPNDNEGLRISACLMLHLLNDSEMGGVLVQRADTIDQANKLQLEMSVSKNSGVPISIDPETDGILKISIDDSSRGAIRKWNSQALRMMGLSNSQISSSNIKDFLPGSIAVQHDDFMSKFLMSDLDDLFVKPRRLFLLHSTGTLRFFYVFLRPVPLTFDSPEPAMLAAMHEEKLDPGECRALMRVSTMRILHVTSSWQDHFPHDRNHNYEELNIPVTSIVTDFLTREKDYRKPDGALIPPIQSKVPSLPKSKSSHKAAPKRRPVTMRPIHFRLHLQELRSQGIYLLILRKENLVILHEADGPDSSFDSAGARRTDAMTFGGNFGGSLSLENHVPEADLFMKDVQFAMAKKGLPRRTVSAPSVAMSTQSLDDPGTPAMTRLASSDSQQISLQSLAKAAASSIDDIGSKKTRFVLPSAEMPEQEQTTQKPLQDIDEGAGDTERNGSDNEEVLPPPSISSKHLFSKRKSMETAVIALAVIVAVGLIGVLTLHFIESAEFSGFALGDSRMVEKFATLGWHAANTIAIARIVTLLGVAGFTNETAAVQSLSWFADDMLEKQTIMFNEDLSQEEQTKSLLFEPIVHLRMIDPTFQAEYEREWAMVEALPVWVTSAKRIVGASLTGKKPGIDAWFLLSLPENVAAIINVLQRITSTRSQEHIRDLEALSIFIAEQIGLSALVCVVIVGTLIPIVARTQSRKDQIMIMLLSIPPKQIRIILEQTGNILKDYLDPDTGLWADVLEWHPDLVLESNITDLFEGNDADDGRVTGVKAEEASRNKVYKKRSMKELQRQDARARNAKSSRMSIVAMVLKISSVFLFMIGFSIVRYHEQSAALITLSQIDRQGLLSAQAMFHMRNSFYSVVRAATLSTANISDTQVLIDDSIASMSVVQSVYHIMVYGGSLQAQQLGPMFVDHPMVTIDAATLTSEKLTSLLLWNPCSLLGNPIDQSDCSEIEAQLYTKGLQNALVEWEAISVRLTRAALAMPANKTSEDVIAFLGSHDLEFLQRSVDGMLRLLTSVAMSSLIDDFNAQVERIQYTLDMLDSVEISGVFVILACILVPFCIHLNDSILTVRALIMHIPPEMRQNIPGLHDYIKENGFVD